jgi:hypothetical protein
MISGGSQSNSLPSGLQVISIDNNRICDEIAKMKKRWISKDLLDNHYSSDGYKCYGKNADDITNDLHGFLFKLPQNCNKSKNLGFKRFD